LLLVTSSLCYGIITAKRWEINELDRKEAYHARQRIPDPCFSPHEVPGGDCIVSCDDSQGVRVIFVGTPGD